MSRRRLLALLSGAALLVIAPAAFAASITTGSTHLGATTIAVPRLYPNSVTAANRVGGTAGKIEANDVLTVVYSEELQASSLCAGAPTQTSPPISGSVNVTITNNAGGGYDLLTVDPVSTAVCTDGVLHLGSLNLGSAGYVTSAKATFTNSTMTLTQTSTTATLSLTLGSAGGSLAKVTSGIAAMYTPDAALKDTALRGIGLNTAVSSTSVQF